MTKGGAMSVSTESLWPDGFGALAEDQPPVAILRQQAELLGEQTKNLVEGEVETTTTDFKRFLRHTFFLVAPTLNFYRYPLLEVEHSATQLYPATIKVAWLDKPQEPNLEVKAETESAFKEGLKTVFADDETQRIIRTLIAQSRDAHDPA
jgi:hypothetical protein